jgi:hypothetical protein
MFLMTESLGDEILDRLQFLEMNSQIKLAGLIETDIRNYELSDFTEDK